MPWDTVLGTDNWSGYDFAHLEHITMLGLEHRACSMYINYAFYQKSKFYIYQVWQDQNILYK